MEKHFLYVMEEMGMITNEKLKECKDVLLKRQTELINHMRDNFGTKMLATEATSELSSYDNHPADMGSALFERGKDIALNEHSEKELEDINKALHAIEEGTYGICVVCGDDISYERLQALPTADRCMEHATDQDQPVEQDRRPIEESVFSPNINPNEKTDEEQTGYDSEDAWQEVSRYGTSETPSDFYGDRNSYDDMYPNSDENVGFVEKVENYARADHDGSDEDSF